MKTGFEDAFMDIQAGLIALCMEVTGGQVEKVYAYASMGKDSQMFNAFFEKEGRIVTLKQLGITPDLAMQFLEVGTEDLDKIRELCIEKEMPVPTEMKMYYDVKSNQYHADYRYENDSDDTGENAQGTDEKFRKWIEERKGQVTG